MIIVDFSNLYISTLMAQLGQHTNAELDENMLRHMTLNTIRNIRKKFTDDYGELILAMDGKNYWRRQVFPYYKALRKQHREASDLDWKAIFEAMDLIKSELREYFPYKVIEVETAEADDVVAAICMEFGQQLVSGEKILIVSSDKDMTQLQKFANVDQWDHIRKRWLKNTTPDANLFEHVVRGDKGDGIPSILNTDDSIVNGIRQRPITQKRINEWVENINTMDEETKRNYNRNQMLINFDFIPQNVRDDILVEFNKEKKVGREKLFDFFITRRMKNLIEVIGDF